MSNYRHSTGVSGASLIEALFEGYDSPNPGNFINPGEPGYDPEVVKQQVAGQLDIQGQTDTQSKAADIVAAAQASGTDTKTLLQNIAGLDASVIQEGTYQDKNYGHTYLKAVADPNYAAQHGIDVSNATVSDLYDKGLMRSGSTDDIDYWEGAEQGSIADVAANFLKTAESQTHQAFDKHFGRMAGAEGLEYFANIESGLVDDTKQAASQTHFETHGVGGGKTLSEYIGGILSYRGGTINPETGKEWAVSAETIARDASYELGGEASTTEQRNPNYYTAPKQADIDRYRDSIRDARADGGDDTAAITAVKDEIFNKADQLLGANQGDFDDMGGIAAGNATGMGRFLSDVEQQTGFDAGKTGDDWYNETKGTVWGALKGEVDKTDIDRELVVRGFDTEAYLKQKAIEEGDTDFDIRDYRMWNQKYLDEGGKKYDSDEWTLDPKKPDLPTDIPITKEKVDYMPGFTSDVKLPSDVKYADRAKEFDTEYKSVPGTAKTAQGTAGQRFTSTSAKGVRMKRSKASRMGTIRGTKQLGREQQTKSLNI